MLIQWAIQTTETSAFRVSIERGGSRFFTPILSLNFHQTDVVARVKSGWPISPFHNLREETNNEPKKRYREIQQDDPACRDGLYPPYIATERRSRRNDKPGCAVHRQAGKGRTALKGRHIFGRSVWVIARSERANGADAPEASF